MKKILIALAALAAAASLEARPANQAQRRVEEYATKEPFRSGVWGVLAVRMDGDTVACYNARQKMVPASNMKLFTTGMALKTLGSDFRFETRLAYRGSIVDGTLVGDLYIIGGGDPSMAAPYDSNLSSDQLFARWKSMLAEAGIQGIQGRVIGDPSFFDGPAISDGWTYDDLGTYYGSGPTGLNFYENRQDWFLTPGAEGDRLSVSSVWPETPWLHVANRTVTVAAKGRNTLVMTNTDLAPEAVIQGGYPADGKVARLQCSNRFGALTCACRFAGYLSANGVEVSGGYADIDVEGRVRQDFVSGDLPQGDAVEIGTTKSNRLVSIVGDTNRESDNLYAETLLRMLGKSMTGSSCYDSCYVAMRTALSSMGLDPKTGFFIYDGSGLSRKNYVSPSFIVSYLRAMSRQECFLDFLSSLPQPGSGTLVVRMKNASPALKSRVYMKSGSMNGVRCFSGYILSSDGNPDHTVAFSLLSNNIVASSWSVYPMLDEILMAIAGQN